MHCIDYSIFPPPGIMTFDFAYNVPTNNLRIHTIPGTNTSFVLGESLKPHPQAHRSPALARLAMHSRRSPGFYLRKMIRNPIFAVMRNMVAEFLVAESIYDRNGSDITFTMGCYMQSASDNLQDILRVSRKKYNSVRLPVERMLIGQHTVFAAIRALFFFDKFRSRCIAGRDCCSLVSRKAAINLMISISNVLLWYSQVARQLPAVDSSWASTARELAEYFCDTRRAFLRSARALRTEYCYDAAIFFSEITRSNPALDGEGLQDMFDYAYITF